MGTHVSGVSLALSEAAHILGYCNVRQENCSHLQRWLGGGEEDGAGGPQICDWSIQRMEEEKGARGPS